MSFHLNTRWGGSESGVSLARMAEVLSELDAIDSEHPDVSLTHESEWCLSAFPSGLVIWENVEDASDPRHMQNVSRQKMLDLWVKLSSGQIETINKESWLPGYGSA